MDFGYFNQAKLFRGEKAIYPATADGTIYLLEKYIGSLERNILVINRSNLVGKPLMHLLLEKNSTVTIAHSKTKDLKKHILENDIIITAVGKREYIKEEDFTESELEKIYKKTYIDIGVTKENGKTYGDIEERFKKEVLSTPTIGGIGPMTIAFLAINILKAYEIQNNIDEEERFSLK